MSDSTTSAYCDPPTVKRRKLPKFYSVNHQTSTTSRHPIDSRNHSRPAPPRVAGYVDTRTNLEHRCEVSKPNTPRPDKHWEPDAGKAAGNKLRAALLESTGSCLAAKAAEQAKEAKVAEQAKEGAQLETKEAPESIDDADWVFIDQEEIDEAEWEMIGIPDLESAENGKQKRFAFF